MKYFAALIFIVLSPLINAETNRPMEEMQGNCDNYKTDLKKEFAMWNEKPVAVAEGRSVQVGTAADLSLVEETKIKFLAPPYKTFKLRSRSYAGLFQFKTGSAGRYRISAGEKLWFDVVGSDKKIVEATTFEMQTKCASILKSVEFELAKDTTYTIQVSSSANKKVRLLVSATNN